MTLTVWCSSHWSRSGAAWWLQRSDGPGYHVLQSGYDGLRALGHHIIVYIRLLYVERSDRFSGACAFPKGRGTLFRALHYC